MILTGTVEVPVTDRKRFCINDHDVTELAKQALQNGQLLGIDLRPPGDKIVDVPASLQVFNATADASTGMLLVPPIRILSGIPEPSRAPTGAPLTVAGCRLPEA